MAKPPSRIPMLARGLTGGDVSPNDCWDPRPLNGVEGSGVWAVMATEGPGGWVSEGKGEVLEGRDG